MVGTLRKLLTPARRPAAPSRRPAVEALGDRVVPASLGFSHGVLSCTGTDNAEQIRVFYNGPNITLTYRDQVTGMTQSVSGRLPDVISISIEARGGDDTVSNETWNPAYINGGADNDVLRGGYGADTFYGEAGDDYIDGREGRDAVTFARQQALTLTDTAAEGQGSDRLASIEKATLTGTSAADSIDASGFSGSLTAYLFGGNDNVWGAQGGNVIYGGDGDDNITGGAGQDYLAGQGGNDHLWGLGDRDTLDGGDYGDWLYGGDGDDNLYGGSGDDDLHGGAGDDYLRGDAGEDHFWGDSGKDNMDGGADFDMVWDLNFFVGEKWKQ
ncbi:MAG: calcium-binding protein [Gemmataceae bacterium]